MQQFRSDLPFDLYMCAVVQEAATVAISPLQLPLQLLLLLAEEVLLQQQALLVEAKPHFVFQQTRYDVLRYSRPTGGAQLKLS